MIGRRWTQRRGAALLIALATLIVVVTASTMLINQAAAIRMQTRCDRCAQIADDAARALIPAIQDWLMRQSAKVVLPLDAVIPRVPVLNDRWNDGEYECALEMTAFDECGMISLRAAQGGSPMRLVLPADVRTQVDSLGGPIDEEVGLDMLAGPTDRPSSRGVFPTSAHDGEAVPALGGLIATHNADPFRINVNTAPMTLVEAALRVVGRGGLDQFKDARSQLKFIATAPATTNQTTSSNLIPQIITASTSWAFRIDVVIGPVRRSWWMVYQLMLPEQRGRPAHAQNSSNDWECVQRLAITE